MGVHRRSLSRQGHLRGQPARSRPSAQSTIPEVDARQGCLPNMGIRGPLGNVVPAWPQPSTANKLPAATRPAATAPKARLRRGCRHQFASCHRPAGPAAAARHRGDLTPTGRAGLGAAAQSSQRAGSAHHFRRRQFLRGKRTFDLPRHIAQYHGHQGTSPPNRNARHKGREHRCCHSPDGGGRWRRSRHAARK